MSMSNTFETNLLNLIFVNLAITLVGDAAGLLPSAGAGSLYISLHTADPGEAGDQTTSEATYGSYARVAVARSAAGWTVSGDTVTNAANILFPAASSGTNTITFFGVGASSAGAGKLIVSGAITTPVAGLAVSTGIAPIFAIGALSCVAQ